MGFTINIPLVDKISSIFSRTKEKHRDDTTETSVQSGWYSYYYRKVKIERTRLAKYGDYGIMDEEYPEISTALDLYADNATNPRGDGAPVQIKSKERTIRVRQSQQGISIRGMFAMKSVHERQSACSLSGRFRRRRG